MSVHQAFVPNRTLDLTQEPNLGLATTEQLIKELVSRLGTSLHGEAGNGPACDRVYSLAFLLGSLSVSEREYRTVDNH